MPAVEAVTLSKFTRFLSAPIDEPVILSGDRVFRVVGFAQKDNSSAIVRVIGHNQMIGSTALSEVRVERNGLRWWFFSRKPRKFPFASCPSSGALLRLRWDGSLSDVLGHSNPRL